MKYDLIKQKVARSLFTAVNNGFNESGVYAMLDAFAEKRKTYESQKELANLCYERVMNWDVRCVGTLRKLFPQWFPKSLIKGDLIAEINEKGDWIVETNCS